MQPYYKYEVIYTRKGSEEKRILICLGKLSQGRMPTVTPYTYAFRIFSSQLTIADVKKFLDTEFGFKYSVKNFIGNEYSVDTYYSMNPDDEIFLNDSLTPMLHTIVSSCIAGDETNTKAYVVNKHDAYRVISPKHLRGHYIFTSTNQLRIHYKIAYV